MACRRRASRSSRRAPLLISAAFSAALWSQAVVRRGGRLHCKGLAAWTFRGGPCWNGPCASACTSAARHQIGCSRRAIQASFPCARAKTLCNAAPPGDRKGEDAASVARGTPGGSGTAATADETPRGPSLASASNVDRLSSSQGLGTARAGQKESVDPWTWVFGKPGELRRDLGMLNTSPEAILLSGFLAIVIGLAANLWGETEFFLAVIPEAGRVARDAKLDSIYAVEGLRGYYTDEYSLRYPSTWLFDQRIALAKFGQTDPGAPLLSSNGRRNLPARAGVLPDAAWGPAGGGQRPAKERENLSVVRQLLPPKPDGSPVELQETLGPPEESLQKLLIEKIAPGGTKRSAEALRAAVVRKASGNVHYEYEWRTRFDAGFALRSYSSVAVGAPNEKNQRILYTLTAVLPEAEADAGRDAATLMTKILDSFRVT